MQLLVHGGAFGRVAPHYLTQMHRLRREVFHDRLQWDVPVNARGLEVDEFDTPDTVYLLVCHEGQVIGTARTMPTVGPNMMADVFPYLVDGPIPCSEDIWDISRFAVTQSPDLLRNGNLSKATFLLVAGLHEVGLAVGLTRMVAIFDTRMEIVLRRAGCAIRRLGEPRQVGNCIAVAGAFEVGGAALDRTRRRGAIATPLVATHVEEIAA